MTAYIHSSRYWLPPLPAEASAAAPRDENPVSAWARTNFNFQADPVQTAILDRPAHRLILCCARQWGKSTIAALKALHMALHQPGALILFVSATYRQSAELLAKIRTYSAQLNGVTAKGDGIHPGAVVLPNGSRILALPPTPAALRSYSGVDLIVVDGAAFVADAVYDALTPLLAASAGALWLLSSPNGRAGEFYNTWAGDAPEWSRHSVNALECPRIAPEFLHRERRSKGQAIFDQEYMCQFSASRIPAIDPEFIDTAFCAAYSAVPFPE